MVGGSRKLSTYLVLWPMDIRRKMQFSEFEELRRQILAISSEYDEID